MASIVSTSTKHFLDTMSGAPVLNTTAGGLIALLEAVLVTGFGSKAITGMVIASGIATITFSAPASAATPESVILLAGVTGTYAALNGEQRVKTVSTTTVTFATDMADGTATLSSATIKMAPLGWEKVFTGTNKAVFRPLDPTGTRPYLRVLDTGASPASAFSARVHMYETMTDVDTGTNMTPPTARLANGNYMWKTNVATTAAQAWTIIGDSRAFYWAPCTHFSGSGTTLAPIGFFGDVKAHRSSDVYSAAMLFPITDVNASTYKTVAGGYNNAGDANCQFMRAAAGLGGSVTASWLGLGATNSGVSGNDTNALGPFPNPNTNGLILSEVVIGQSPIASNGVRGVFPGAAFVPQSATAGYFARASLTTGTGLFSGAKLLCVPGGGSLTTATNDFPLFFDVTRDWRA